MVKRAAVMLEDRLRDWAAARGYLLAIKGTGVIETVRKKLEERRERGLIEAGFFHDNLGSFRYLGGSAIEGPRCLVMVAVPSPIHVLTFTKAGKKIEGLIPPTYVQYNRTFVDVLADMRESALGKTTQAEILKAPLKSLAVHMGLVRYGRNNITYAPGLGSGHQLCGYVVGTEELPARSLPVKDSTDWSETMLERCVDCRVCLKACPTGAIREDRFLIMAERCFTLHSESRKPIPAWAEPPTSICLIGCMACQQACPENKGRLKSVPSGVELTAEETEAVIKAGRRLAEEPGGASEGSVDPQESAARRSARAKIDRLGLSEDFDVMGRNLDLFLKRS
jgi:epoxyqueuosine reductase